MIEMSMTGMCNGCEYGNLKLIFDADHGWQIHCGYEEICERAEKLTMKHMKKESEWYG